MIKTVDVSEGIRFKINIHQKSISILYCNPLNTEDIKLIIDTVVRKYNISPLDFAEYNLKYLKIKN
jgi:hypothetical protein